MSTEALSGRRAQMVADARAFEAEAGRVAVVSYPPRHVTIGVTSACPNRCVFCAYHAEDARGHSRVSDLPFRLELDVFRRMVDLCHAGRVPRVHICGTGEPFTHRDILAMIDYVIDVYGEASVQTNFERRLFAARGYLAALLERAGKLSYITTDLMSGDPATHERLKLGSRYADVLDAMEQLSARAGLRFEAHLVLTKYNWQHLDELVDEIAARGISARLAIVNLHAYGFNAVTAPEARYFKADTQITAALQAARARGKQRGVEVVIPRPVDEPPFACGAFWSRFQTWPAAGNDPQRYGENVIIGGCAAVAVGGLNTLGYIFDYPDIMALWNNEHFVRIRAGLLRGEYPDAACVGCQSHPAVAAQAAVTADAEEG